ncbi:unnamed protein product [Schistosoma curassoni]|uniref:Ovule protein n=1 Tax=Schistosoma curassoni TaxID=6186 RepID=A0A183KQ93_9TREM|nr:unnamed protein product [Schistosoma curassoni]
MYLHCRVDVHSGTQTQYHSLLAVESSSTRVSSSLGLVSWMYLHLRVDVYSGTPAQYRSLRTPSLYPLSYLVLIPTWLCNGVKLYSLGVVYLYLPIVIQDCN